MPRRLRLVTEDDAKYAQYEADLRAEQRRNAVRGWLFLAVGFGLFTFLVALAFACCK